jgi:ubiquinone/menaquinone biosynthesis C-methylase UbiE
VLADLLRSTPLTLRTVRAEVNRGPAAGRELAWRACRGSVVVFTDDDCQPEPDWLAAHLRTMGSAAPAVVVGRTVPDPEQQHLLVDFARTQRVDDTRFAQTCNVAYRHEDLVRAGGFDTGFATPGGEDTDLALRVEQLGSRRVFAPGAVVRHDVRPTSLRATLRETLRWYDLPRLYAKHPAAGPTPCTCAGSGSPRTRPSCCWPPAASRRSSRGARRCCSWPCRGSGSAPPSGRWRAGRAVAGRCCRGRWPWTRSRSPSWRAAPSGTGRSSCERSMRSVPRDEGAGAPDACAASGGGPVTGPVDPFARHRLEVPQALAGGTPQDIKRLYVHLGQDLEAAFGDDPAATPRLSYPETAQVVAAAVPDDARLVLDVGCGPDPGAGTLLGARPGTRVVALDIGLGTVRLARAKAALAGVELLCVVADAEHLPFREGTVDAAVCDDTIEHLPDDARGMAELARVVRPGGRVVVATPNRWSAQVLARRARDLRAGRRRPASAYYAAESHLREYTWPQLERLARAAGLRVVGRRSVDWPGGGRRRLASTLTSRAPGRLLSRMLVVVLER